MDKVSIKQVADELGINKDYALRLVRNRGEQLGIAPQYGKRNTVYLSRADANTLIADYKPRRSLSASLNDSASIEGFGYFYIFQLHPKDLPNRMKFGYTDNRDVRKSDHQTIAPTLKLVASWPCKKIWEFAAIASITRNSCEHVGGEVYDGEVQVFVQRAEAFFAVMPQPSVGNSNNVDEPQ